MALPTPSPLGFPSGLEGLGSLDWDAEYEALAETTPNDALCSDEDMSTLSDSPTDDEGISPTSNAPPGLGSIDWEAEYEALAEPTPSSDEKMTSTIPDSLTNDEDISSTSPSIKSSDCGAVPDDSVVPNDAVLLNDKALPDDMCNDLAAYANEPSDPTLGQEANSTVIDCQHPGWTFTESASWEDWTSTSPEVCAWFLSPAIFDDAKWIVKAQEEGDEYAHNDIPRIAALLRCGLRKCYDVRDTPSLQFPPMARGYKAFSREENQGPREIFKRGAKGFKDAGDPEIEFLEPFVPLGESLKGRDRRPAGTKWYFPQPSRLSHVWNADEMDEGHHAVSKNAACLVQDSSSEGSGNWAAFSDSSSIDDDASTDTSMESIELSPPGHVSSSLGRSLEKHSIKLVHEELPVGPTSERDGCPHFDIHNESDDPFTGDYDAAVDRDDDAVDEEDTVEITANYFNEDSDGGEFDVSDDVFDSAFCDEDELSSGFYNELDEAFAGDIEYTIEDAEAVDGDTTNNRLIPIIANQGDHKADDDDHEADGHEADGHQADKYDAGDYEADAHEADCHEDGDYEADYHEAKGYELNDYEPDVYGLDVYGPDVHETDVHGADGHEDDDYEADDLEAYGYEVEDHESSGYETDDHEAANHDEQGKPLATSSITTPPIPSTPESSFDSLHELSQRLTQSAVLQEQDSAKKSEPVEKTLYQGFFEEFGGVEADAEAKSTWGFSIGGVVGAVCGVVKDAVFAGSPFLY